MTDFNDFQLSDVIGFTGIGTNIIEPHPSDLNLVIYRIGPIVVIQVWNKVIESKLPHRTYMTYIQRSI